MKVLMFSIDQSILSDGSESEKRMKEYGSVLDELHIIIHTAPGFKEKQISEEVRAYPTNTVFKPFYFLGAYRIGRRIIHDSGFMIHDSYITSQDAFTNIPAIFLKKRFGIPFQAQIHTDFLSPFFRRESLKNYIRYRLYCRSVQNAECIRVVSARIKNSLISTLNIPQSKISILPVFVDIARVRVHEPVTDLHKKYPEAYPIILMASRITREKNIEGVCRAVRSYAGQFPSVLLLVVGDGSLRAALQKKYEKDGIRFEGAVSYETLLSYYKTADLFLISSNYEGYGRTVVEALASGLPVLSADVGIAREIIQEGKTGMLLGEGPNEEEIMRKLNVLLSHTGYLEKLKQNAEEFSKKIAAPAKEEYLAKMREGFEKCDNM